MNPGHGNEDRLVAEALHALDPSRAQVARMNLAIEARLERRSRPLAREWLDLLRARPLAHGALALVGAGMVLLTTPAGPLLWSVLGLVR